MQGDLTAKKSFLPRISLSKLKLQSVVNLVMGVGISDMENIFTWKTEILLAILKTTSLERKKEEGDDMK